MIHSRSYTYIIKNVYSNPGDVFDTILDDEKVMERASSVTESYDDFISHAHEYDNGTMWDLAREGHPTGQYDRRELKRKLYRASLMLTFWKAFTSTFPSRVRLLLARINLWRLGKDTLSYC